MSKRNKTTDAQQAQEVEETGDINDMDCVDCHRKYPLVPGASNCRCKRCNTLYKVNGSYLHKPLKLGSAKKY